MNIKINHVRIYTDYIYILHVEEGGGKKVGGGLTTNEPLFFRVFASICVVFKLTEKGAKVPIELFEFFVSVSSLATFNIMDCSFVHLLHRLRIVFYQYMHKAKARVHGFNWIIQHFLLFSSHRQIITAYVNNSHFRSFESTDKLWWKPTHAYSNTHMCIHISTFPTLIQSIIVYFSLSYWIN